MSSALSLYGRQQLMAAVFNADTFVVPSQFWLALCPQAPMTNDSGATIVECPNPGYSRLPVPLGSANWTFINPTEVAYTGNSGTIVQSPPMTDAQGLLAGWGLVDSGAIGAGNLWALGTFSMPFQMDNITVWNVQNLLIGLYD